jgi:hypothetical protein
MRTIEIIITGLASLALLAGATLGAAAQSPEAMAPGTSVTSGSAVWPWPPGTRMSMSSPKSQASAWSRWARTRS